MTDYITLTTGFIPELMDGATLEDRRPGPYEVTAEIWYDNQCFANVTDATGFTQMLVPVDEGDGDSASDLLGILLSVNKYPELLRQALPYVPAELRAAIEEALP